MKIIFIMLYYVCKTKKVNIMQELLIFISSMDKVFLYVFLTSFIMLFITMFFYSSQTEESYISNVMWIITHLERCMAIWIIAVTVSWGCLLISLFTSFFV